MVLEEYLIPPEVSLFEALRKIEFNASGSIVVTGHGFAQVDFNFEWLDGGSNGYERAANYRTIVEYVPEEQHKCEIMDWLWYINSDSEEFPLCIN